MITSEHAWFRGTSQFGNGQGRTCRTLRLMTLEDRMSPAVASISSGVLTLEYTSTGIAAEAVSISNDGVNIELTGNVTGTLTAPATSVMQIVVFDCGLGTAQSLTLTGTSAFSLGQGLSSSGVETVTVNQTIVLGAGANLLVSGATITTNKPVTTSGGSITLAATGNITLNDSLVTGGGNLTVNADSDGDGVGSVTLSATIVDGWAQQQLLTASAAAVNDDFGHSVAISSDGSTAIIGAPSDDIGANTDQGTATVFVRSGSVWVQQQQLTMIGGAKGDQFGQAVALSSDGNTAIVGAPADVVTFAFQGSATVFTRSGGVWTQQQQLTGAGASSSDFFGNAVAISSDGDTAIVGAYLDNLSGGSNQGTATVFTRNGGVWTQQKQLTGSAVGGQFGTSVALSSDGNTAIVGAPVDDNAGAVSTGSASVFVRNAGLWTIQQRLFAADGASADYFGSSVALSGDGNTAIVGARYDDVDFVDQGSATVFTRSNAVWTQQQRLTAATPAANDEFGTSVALSSDGNTAIVGAPRDDVAGVDQGSISFFTRIGGVWSQEQLLVAPVGAAGDSFGSSVAVRGDGLLAIATAPGDDVTITNQGSAGSYQFTQPIAGGSIASGSGVVNIGAADADIRGPISSNNIVSLIASQKGRGIDLGTNATGTLGLTDSELDQVFTPVLKVGNSESGLLTVSAAITRLVSTNLQLITGADVAISGGMINTNGGSLLLATGPAQNIRPTWSGVDATVGSVAFSNGAELTLDIAGTALDTQYSQLNVVGDVDLSGAKLKLTGSYIPVIGDTWTIVAATSRFGTFNNAMDGSTIALNGIPLRVRYSSTAVTLTAEPPRVRDVVINDGAGQRSRVTVLEVTFDRKVSLPASPASAFTLNRLSDNAAVTLAAAVDNSGPATVVALSFVGGPVEAGSLADGRYTLKVLAGQVDGGVFDGNGDTFAGDDYVLASTTAPSPPTNIFRIFGDANGDGHVDNSDFLQFRLAFLQQPVSPLFDIDGDGQVNSNDFLQFRLRFLQVV